MKKIKLVFLVLILTTCSLITYYLGYEVKNKNNILSNIDHKVILKFFYEATIYNQLVKPNYTRVEYVDALYQMMQDISQVFDILGINYRIIGGTLLGAVRHHGVIPWSDNINIAIDAEQEQKFEKCALSILEQLKYLNIKQSFYYRVIASNNLIDLEEEELYPVCDIYIALTINEKKIINGNKQHNLTANQWIIGHKYKLGNLYLWGISEPEIYLNNLYGENWDKFAMRGDDNRTMTGSETSHVPFALQDKDYQPLLPSKVLIDNRQKIRDIINNNFCG